MKIDAKVVKTFDTGNVKAICDVTLDDAFAIHGVKLIKGQNGIDNALIMLCLILFRNARSYKNRLCIRDAPLDIKTVRLHRRYHIRKIRQQLRKMLLYQQVDRVAAGGNDNIPALLTNQMLVFALYDGRADRRLLNIVKAELLDRVAHRLDTDAVVVCDK